MKDILHRIVSAWASASAVTRWRAVCGGVVLGLAVWLLVADKPWSFPEVTKLRQIVAVQTWWGGAVALVIAGGLGLLCPWWAAGPPCLPRSSRPSPRAPVWFWPLVLAAVVLTAGFAAPRLGFGLWDDEELCVRDSLAGRFKRDAKTGEVRFHNLPWQVTVFGYETPNNHVLHSLAARASHEVARRVAPSRDGLPFVEWGFRLPAFLFGLGAVAALAWFFKEMGFPAAGVVAAFLAALHPWFLRYASEARGYSLALLLTLLLFVWWHRAVVRGGWRDWAAVGALQFGLLYTYPGMAFLLVVLNVLTLPVLALSRLAAGPFRRQSGRWFCANAVAAAVTIFLMLPLVPQARIYFDYEAGRQILLGWSWVRSALSYLLAGVPWAGGTDHVALSDLARVSPAALGALIWTAVGLVLIGLVRFARGGLPQAALAAAIVLTPVLTFGFARLRMMLIYEAYILYALPGLLGFAALGMVTLAQPLGTRHRAAGVAVVLVFIGFFAAATQPFRQWIVTKPLQQIRESVLASRPTLAPDDPRQNDILTASFCIPPYLYDARMVRVDSADELLAAMRRADQEEKPLFLNIGMPWAAREYSPKMWALFSDDRLFTDRKTFPGFDAGLNRIVARYRPGSLAAADLTDRQGPER
jgi:hypothetical protein